VLIHGDAAFPGQGIVAETLNLSRLPGYRTGGTLHIVVNNQLGFTAEPRDARSTLYASDLAKGFEIPIIHVNADDPEACIAAARIAHGYREQFHKDVLVDLVGYRRWGHNEGDDPSFTQPRLYALIARHPTVRELFAAELVRRGVVSEPQVAELLATHTAALQQALSAVNARLAADTATESGAGQPEAGPEPVERSSPRGELAPRPLSTGVERAWLEEANGALYTVPPGFALHPRLERPMQRRRGAFDDPAPGTESPVAVDWGQAESLAFAAILRDGTPIRLTGQDCRRGTFSQRHAVLFDYHTGAPHTPLHHVPGGRASFEVVDSPVTEAAVLGFEYGYSVQAPDALVLWEAQYGDFVNGAQVIVDQFATSARAKWGQEPSLVLLLPHGYEGQGPEHSSARLERFVQAAAEDNIRVANCTTASQYFHLLRRQAALLHRDPRPLVVMTPKSLLRHPLAASSPEELDVGTAFQPVLDDPFIAPPGHLEPEEVCRLALCSGKVYVDLASAPEREAAPALAIVRLEELYPFPEEELARVLARYLAVEDVVWVQEEPQNMGAWAFIGPRLDSLLAPRGLRLRYIGRPERASPSEGAPAWHAAEQARIVAETYDGLLPRRREDGTAADVPETARTVAAASRMSG
jgi:2-oxoglutarate dehydrogenase E1 component